MGKDREAVFALTQYARLRYRRSSTLPIEYSITLEALRDGRWWTVRTFDNAHDAEEHHEHAYQGATKLPPQVTHGPVNEAMSAALLKLRETWPETVLEWDQHR